MLVLIETSGFWIITSLGIAVSQSCVHGVIFVLLVNHLLKKRKPIVTLLKDGAILGFRRLFTFVASVRSTTRLISTTILIIIGCHFGRIKDIHKIFKIFVKVTCLPFFIWLPHVEEFEQAIYYMFSVSWWLLEILLSLVFTIFGCVAMVNPYIADMAVVERGFHLLSLNIRSVIGLKFLEEIVFGSLTRYILSQIFGHLFASFVQSFMEVYFLMVWTTYYFCVKSMDAHRRREPFGRNVFRNLIKI
ncbi:uncharacterized protein [Rutidosis leptorrhynchoides]|uniref:uncharacterized protein n=1 Tax=Rutidosis leptorrhynchoides TaxID=125765 RepID=UPI003A9A1217